MPRRKVYPETSDLFEKCMTVAEDFVKWQYVKALRPRSSVPGKEVRLKVRSCAVAFYSVLKAGAIKPLYLMTPEATRFIETTAFAEKLEPGFFVENFSRPLVLYSGEPKTLVDDVLCIELIYNAHDATLECQLSHLNETPTSREAVSSFSIDDLTGIFSRRSVSKCESNGYTYYFSRPRADLETDDLVTSELDKFYDAMLYAFKFVLLLQCQKQTIVVEPQHRKHNNIKKQKQIFGTLQYQRVSLTTEYRTAIEKCRGPDDTLVLDKEGKELKATRVRGFLRRQHYGPENSLTKVIYIDAHESHSWMNTGLRIVKVVK